jgi:hypothetical protein
VARKPISASGAFLSGVTVASLLSASRFGGRDRATSAELGGGTCEKRLVHPCGLRSDLMLVSLLPAMRHALRCRRIRMYV